MPRRGVARRAGGDARTALNVLELAWSTARSEGVPLEEVAVTIPEGISSDAANQLASISLGSTPSDARLPRRLM